MILRMLTKVMIGKKSDAHDSKESPRFASRQKKNYTSLLTWDLGIFFLFGAGEASGDGESGLWGGVGDNGSDKLSISCILFRSSCSGSQHRTTARSTSLGRPHCTSYSSPTEIDTSLSHLKYARLLTCKLSSHKYLTRKWVSSHTPERLAIMSMDSHRHRQ